MDKLKKQVLSIIDSALVSNFLDTASFILKTKKDKIQEIINSLLKDKLITVIEFPDEKSVYSHTLKVKRKMLDEDLHYEYGSRPLSTYS